MKKFRSKVLKLQDDARILISRTDRLGDLILALPFVETIKSRYPQSTVDVIASLYASPILENNKNINKILRVQNDQLLSNKMYKKDLLQKIRKGKYDIVVALYPERQISRLFYKANIPTRVGTAGRFHSIFFNTLLFHSRKKNLKHEFEYNLDFLTFFKKGKKITFPKVYLRQKEIDNARRILNDAQIAGEFIVIHPGSGGSAERWPIGNFIKLYRILEKKGLQLIVSGSEQEGIIIDKVSKEMGIKIKKMTGDTDLRTLAAVLSLARLVIANSTGPLHLSVAVGTQVAGLYPSKKAMSPVRWGPLGEKDRVIQPPGEECHCPPRHCVCMQKVTPEKVAVEILEMLNDNG